MMDFIVLGLVPGTSFQVTFNWVIGIGTSLCVLACIKKLDEHAKHNTANNQQTAKS